MKGLGEIAVVRGGANGKPAPVDARTALSVTGVAKRDVAFAGQGALPALPEPPRPLVEAIENRLSPHPEAGYLPVTAEVHHAACIRLKLLEERTRDATAKDWLAFLLPVANGRLVANAPDIDELPRAAEDFHAAMGPVPVCVLTAEAQRELLSEEFFPRVAALKRVLGPAIRKALRERPALRALVKAPVEEARPVEAGPYLPLPGAHRRTVWKDERKPGGDEEREPAEVVQAALAASKAAVEAAKAKAWTDAELAALAEATRLRMAALEGKND